MVKFVVRIVAFMVILSFLIGSLKNCTGSYFDKFLDDIFSFSSNTKDKDDVSCDDIKNADPTQLNIYANIMLSNINQQYVTYNTTNIDVSQTITSVDTRIENYNQTITNQTNYISRTNINQNTLINWVTDNREFISQLEKQYTNLTGKNNSLQSEIKKLKQEIKSLKKSVDDNRKHFESYIKKYNQDVIENERIKYDALINELKTRIDELSAKVSALSDELKSNTKKIEQLKKSVDKCIKKIDSLNKKLDSLIEQSGTALEDVNYYYIIDTKDNLKSKGIVSSSVFSSDLTVASNPDKDHFAILTNKNKTITLGREKDSFELLSDMPVDSYEFRTINNKKVLIITDIKSFWSKTKYLIIIKK